jgi:hypothetical protein
MSRFNYQAERDEKGKIVGTYIEETGGFFEDWYPEELSKIAEQFTPLYRSAGMSDTFPNVYYNHCLRKELEKYKVTPRDNLLKKNLEKALESCM